MIELLSWIFLGCIAGIFTGLLPGIHVNTISLLVLLFASENNLHLVLFIVALSVTHSFLDFIPSILLGAPSDDTFLSILPGHHYFLKGRGLYAIKLTALGGLFAGVFSIFLIPFYGLFLIKFFSFFKFLIPVVLGLTLFLMVFSEEDNKKKLISLIVIFLASFLGIIVLRNLIEVQNGLFVVITGFFGLSNLLYSLTKKTFIKKQVFSYDSYNGKVIFLCTLISSIAGLIVSIFPGIGPSEASFLVQQFFKQISRSHYLIILGGINTVNAIFGFFSLYFIGKTRTGAALAVKSLLQLNDLDVLFILFTIIFAIGFSTILVYLISFKAIKLIEQINYFQLNLFSLIFVLMLATFLTNLIGLIVLVISTFIGLIPISNGIRRTHLMAFLIFPVLVFYLTN